jgi:hypothetical protein
MRYGTDWRDWRGHRDQFLGAFFLGLGIIAAILLIACLLIGLVVISSAIADRI